MLRTVAGLTSTPGWAASSRDGTGVPSAMYCSTSSLNTSCARSSRLSSACFLITIAT
jgi:hypothetical protein